MTRAVPFTKAKLRRAIKAAIEKGIARRDYCAWLEKNRGRLSEDVLDQAKYCAVSIEALAMNKTNSSKSLIAATRLALRSSNTCSRFRRSNLLSRRGASFLFVGTLRDAERIDGRRG